jgi:hypothetical protein
LTDPDLVLLIGSRSILGRPGAGVVGIAALVVAILPKAPSSSSAAGTIAAFYAALGERDATKARGLLAPNPYRTGPTSLLSDRTLRDPGYTPPSQVKVTPLPDSATEYVGLQVDYLIAGVARRQTVRMTRAGSARQWRVVDGVESLPLEISVSQGTLVVAGTSYVPSYPSSIYVFPGAYVVTLHHPLFEAAPVTVRTGGPSTRFKLDIMPSVRGDVTNAVNKRIGQRAADVEAGRYCPFWKQVTIPNLPAGSPFQTSLTVLSYPTITLETAAGAITVATASPGQLRVVESDRTTGKPVFDQTEPFTVTGSIELLEHGDLYFKMTG